MKSIVSDSKQSTRINTPSMSSCQACRSTKRPSLPNVGNPGKFDQYYQNTQEQRIGKVFMLHIQMSKNAALAIEGIWFKGLQMGLIVA